MENQTVFLVHHTCFDYKPGHMYITCEGIFTSWEVAFRKALEISIEKEDEEKYDDEEDEEKYDDEEDDKGEKEDKNEDILKNLPTTEQELRNLLPVCSCIWAFKNNCNAEWWDGDEPGAHLVSVSQQQIKEKDDEKDDASEDDNSDDSEVES